MQSALVLAMVPVALPASAHPINYRHHHLAQGSLRRALPSAWNERRHQEGREASGYRSSGVVTVSTAAGPITVASDAADKFVNLTNDLVAHGFHGSVNCLASGHMPGSLHHTGHACDFAQTARNRTVSLMYHAQAIIAAHGLRDGCSFGDCGHVDTGAPLEGRRFAASSTRHQAERIGYRDRAVAESRVAPWDEPSGLIAASPRPSPDGTAPVIAGATGRSVVMRFPTDRGPFARKHVMQVSPGAAHAFNLARHGRGRLERM
jgi:hypothetical protein